MDKQTIETYNVLAKEYDDETINFWERFPRTFIDRFATEIGSGKVLDVGSGPGRDGLLLKEKALDVTCLDASSAMIELSTERGLTSVVGDFLELPFEDSSFQGVWAYTSLLHVPKKDIGRALAEIRRVIVPGGVFGLGLIEGDTESYRESSGVGQPRWFAYYTKDEIEELLQEHGFESFYFDSFQPKSNDTCTF